MIASEELTRKKGQYQAKYGIEMDEFSVTLYNEMEEHFTEMRKQLARNQQEIAKAADKINRNMNSVHFENNRQAFVFGLAKFFPLGIAFLLNGLLAFILVQNNKANNAFFENAEILNKEGIECISLKHAKKLGDAQIGKQYFYDKASQQILVPIQKE